MNNTLQEVSSNQLTKKQVHSPWSAQKVRKRCKPNVSFHPDILSVHELDESYGSPPKLQKRQDATPYPSQGNDHRLSTEDSYDFHATKHSNQAPLLPLNHRSDAPHHHAHTDINSNNESPPSTTSPPITFSTHHNAINKPATTPSAAAAAKSTPPTTSSLSMFERLVHACRSGGQGHSNGPSRSTTTPHKNNNTIIGTFSIKGCFKSPFSGGRPHTSPPFQDGLDHHQPNRVAMDGGGDDDGEIVTLHHHQQRQEQEQTPVPPQPPPPSPIDEDMFGLTHDSENNRAFGIISIIRPPPGGRGGGGRREEREGGAIILPSPILYEEEEEEEEEAETENHHQEQPAINMNNAKLETPLDVDALNEMLSSMCRLRDQAPDPREAQALVEAAEHAGVEIDGVTILRLKQLEQIHEQCSPLR